MRAGTHIIHLRGRRGTAQGSLLHERIDLIGGAYSPFTQPLDEDTLLLVFPDLQARAVYLQQVTNHLVIDL